MTELEWAGAFAGLGVFGFVALGLLAQLFSGRKNASGTFARNRDGSFVAVCTVCATHTQVRADALVRLSSAEKALVVREKPAALGKDLVEFICPQCDGSHCFSVERDVLTLIGVNLYEGQQFQVQCKECRRPLALPPWSPGTFDGRIADAPGDIGDFGLVCGFCGAMSCVSCCKTLTRNRTSDGSLLCPRCYRGPLERFYHAVERPESRN